MSDLLIDTERAARVNGSFCARSVAYNRHNGPVKAIRTRETAHYALNTNKLSTGINLNHSIRHLLFLSLINSLCVPGAALLVLCRFHRWQIRGKNQVQD